MLFKLVAAFLVLGFVAAASGPRKLYKTGENGLESVSTFTDPITGRDYRLPNTTRPLHYNVWLSTAIHQRDFDFEGVVDIHVEAVNNTADVVVQSRQLTIYVIDLLTLDGTVVEEDVAHSFQADPEFLVITPSQALIAGQQIVLRIYYGGVLRNDDAGFYRSSYINASGERVWLAMTQFESTDARHGFPCYDEPAIRSSYTIQIRHDASYAAISNMPQASRVPEATGNFVLTTFETIPSIQSYLIAFIVSDFTFAEDTARHVPQRVFARPQSIANGYAQLAIDESFKILEALEEYLGINYTLPKMDQVAIPDFAAGAMENWGLVTYRDEYLLFNEETGTTRNRENVIATIAHEFVHQWFGNLVSPAWWSFLWLNEGFATLYENHILSLVYPDDGVDGSRWVDTFLIDTVQPVMETDANPNIRPMSYYVESPGNIDRLFDSVAYSKSGSVLRMFQNAFGDSTWAKGLNYYLTARGSNFATPSHLYENVQRAVNEDSPSNPPDVDQVMSSWETQSGLPYITVTREGSTLTFEQNRFMYTNRNSNTLWWVPISYVVGSNPNFTDSRADLWMPNDRNLSIESATAPKRFTENDWIVVNIQQSGYYRVNYDSNLWDLIIEQLDRDGDAFDQIHLFNRAQLIDDSYHFARAGLLNYDTTLRVMNYLEKETDYIPWSSTNRANTNLNRWLTGSSIYSQYQAFMSKNSAALFNRLGAEIIIGEPRVDRYARIVAINIACQAQLEACLSQTSQRLQLLIDNGTALAPDLVSSVYCNGVRAADASLFFSIQNRIFQSASQTDRNNLLSALGCTQNPSLLMSYLNLAITPGVPLTNNERTRILSSPINIGVASISTMIRFLEVNRIAVASIGYVNNMCANIASRISTQELLNDFDSLLNVLQSNNLLTVNQVTSHRANANVILDWQNLNLEPIESFFNSRIGSP